MKITLRENFIFRKTRNIAGCQKYPFYSSGVRCENPANRKNVLKSKLILDVPTLTKFMTIDSFFYYTRLPFCCWWPNLRHIVISVCYCDGRGLESVSRRLRQQLPPFAMPAWTASGYVRQPMLARTANGPR